MKPILSIVIPCYNSESTLEGTLESVLHQDFQDWEAIIVNDGSPDNVETIALTWLEKDERFKYYKKQNGGLGSARNYGINKAKGEFILPLDSDNQVKEDYALKAIPVFIEKRNVGVVYGHAEYYGERTGIWKVDDFNLNKILNHNYIDACAIFRKGLWEKIGGYDQHMPHQGHEDWDFWISMTALNVEFYHLKQVAFRYYVSNTSMIKSFTDKMVLENQDYIVKKHSAMFHKQFQDLFNSNREQQIKFLNKISSRKFVIDAFCKKLLGFKLFNSELDKL